MTELDIRTQLEATPTESYVTILGSRVYVRHGKKYGSKVFFGTAVGHTIKAAAYMIRHAADCRTARIDRCPEDGCQGILIPASDACACSSCDARFALGEFAGSL